MKWFYGYPEQEQLKKRLTVTFQALRGLQVIRHGTIGVLGEIAPTFLIWLIMNNMLLHWDYRLYI